MNKMWLIRVTVDKGAGCVLHRNACTRSWNGADSDGGRALQFEQYCSLQILGFWVQLTARVYFVGFPDKDELWSLVP